MRSTLGKYQLGRTLGSGVSCKVKVAKDSTNKRVAIKILHSEPIFHELSKQEVKTLKDLNHPNIVNLIEEGQAMLIHPKKESKKVDYIVLELVQGGELFDYVANSGRFTEPICRYYFGQLMGALKYMHDNGYTHRDLKPENIMLDSDFNLKVADFGFACSTNGKKGTGFCTTQLGTASYMAPEIHLGKPYNGPSVDLFACAIILFVMISQRPPFNSAHPNDTHYRLLAADRCDLFWNAHDDAEKGPTLFTKEFRDLFSKMTKLNPNQRLKVDEIIDHPWFTAHHTASKQDVHSEFVSRKKLVDDETQKDRDSKRAERAHKNEARKVKRGEGKDDENEDEEINLQESEAWQTEKENWPDYEPCIAKQTQIFTTGNPADLVIDLKDWLHKQTVEHKQQQTTFDAFISESTWLADPSTGKVKFALLDGRSAEPVQIALHFLRVDEQTLCCEFIRKSGSQQVFFDKFKQIKTEVLDIYNDAVVEEEQ